MRLRDKIAIVTGGGQGIGRATARLFAREGAKVVIASRTEAKLAQVKKEIEAEGGQVLAVPTDVAKSEEVKALVDATGDRFGGLDVLVNNAGIGLHLPVDEVETADYDRVMDTNLRGMYHGCHFAVPLLKARGGGAIINISSVHGVDGSPLNTVYAATKGGIIGCTRGLAAELALHRIRVNTISPGAIWLEMYEENILKQVKAEDQGEFVQRFGEGMKDSHKYFQPLEVVGMPNDIAHCALYLAADESRFVTGQNIVVDGGLTTYLSPYAPPGSRQKMEAAGEPMRAWMAEHQVS
ncbi:MAG: SDR family oxidoreductase [Candidatus Latescibacteria bacterium]|nr:SDR family oxidoreductase [Candidatus Latescibacterota bacterium]